MCIQVCMYICVYNILYPIRYVPVSDLADQVIYYNA